MPDIMAEHSTLHSDDRCTTIVLRMSLLDLALAFAWSPSLGSCPVRPQALSNSCSCSASFLLVSPLVLALPFCAFPPSVT